MTYLQSTQSQMQYIVVEPSKPTTQDLKGGGGEGARKPQFLALIQIKVAQHVHMYNFQELTYSILHIYIYKVAVKSNVKKIILSSRQFHSLSIVDFRGLQCSRLFLGYLFLADGVILFSHQTHFSMYLLGPSSPLTSHLGEKALQHIMPYARSVQVTKGVLLNTFQDGTGQNISAVLGPTHVYDKEAVKIMHQVLVVQGIKHYSLRYVYCVSYDLVILVHSLPYNVTGKSLVIRNKNHYCTLQRRVLRYLRKLILDGNTNRSKY